MTGASACPDRLNSGDENGRELDGRRPLRLYLAGPMSGLEDFNYPAFHAVARKLRAAGAVVLNPAESDIEPGADTSWGDWMRRGIRLLLDADGVALLPGAAGSRGAAIECRLAHDLAIPVRTVPAWLTHLGQVDYMRRIRAGREAGN